MPEITATTVDEATAVGGDVYHPHHLRTRGDDGFRMRIRAATWNQVVVGTLEYASAVRISAEPFADSYQINLPLDGAMRTAAAGKEALMTPTRAVVHGPSEPTSIEGWSRPTTLMGVKLPHAMVDTAFERLADGGERSAPPMTCIDIERPIGAAWLRLARRIAWWHAGGLHDEIIDDTLRDAMVLALVRAMSLADLDGRSPAGGIGSPHPIHAASTVQSSDARAGFTRPRGDLAAARAVAIMHAHADSNASVADLSRAVGIGVRALEKRTVAEYGTTPSQLWRRIRLAYAHRELHGAETFTVDAAGEPIDDAASKIGRVAAKWGFAHAGRFSSTYEQRYGELPSATAARAGRRAS